MNIVLLLILMLEDTLFLHPVYVGHGCALVLQRDLEYWIIGKLQGDP